MDKEVVILTMSSKNKKYCVAGIDKSSGKWIRLISNDASSHGALSRNEVRYSNGMQCKPLDIAKVSIIEERPSDYQPENTLIDTQKRWRKIDELTVDDLLKIYPPERHAYLLGNQYAYITEARIGAVGHSLIMVKVNNLTIYRPYGFKIKAMFTYNGCEYEDISVTDPEYFENVEFKYKTALLVMSLPEFPFPENRYYKFIAKIFPLS